MRCVSGNLVILEGKGSTRPIRTPASYLKRTKTKGRQLSWDWCWSSAIDLAEHPATAVAFLGLYQGLILGKAERMLAVTKARRVTGGFLAEEVEVWDEARLAQYPWLAEPRDWTRQQEWLADLDGEDE